MTKRKKQAAYKECALTGGFTQLPKWISRCKELTSSAKQVYGYLFTKVGADTDRVTVKLSSICEQTGTKERTVRRAIDSLVKIKLLKKPIRRGCGLANQYEFEEEPPTELTVPYFYAYSPKAITNRIASMWEKILALGFAGKLDAAYMKEELELLKEIDLAFRLQNPDKTARGDMRSEAENAALYGLEKACEKMASLIAARLEDSPEEAFIEAVRDVMKADK